MVGTSDEQKSRSYWTGLTDNELLRQCEVDTYRASGPGGQKRNKTDSAVRIRHKPTALLVIAEESRSQHENKAKALQRLREAFFIKMREDVQTSTEENYAAAEPEFAAAIEKSGRLRIGRKAKQFWPTVARILDYVDAHEARISDVARAIGISTGNLIDFLQESPKVWDHVNILRGQYGQKPLKNT